MVGLALKEQSEFGIVLAEGRGIVNVGCSVSVEEVVTRYDDGRMDIICVGKRRFRIASVDQEEDLIRANVQFFDDEDASSTAAQRIEALSAWEQAKPLLPERREEPIDPTQPQLSFRLADAVPELDARQIFLELRSEEDRLKQIVAYFAGYASRLARAAHARRVAPTNGHGGIDPRATQFE